mgnify:FL=1
MKRIISIIISIILAFCVCPAGFAAVGLGTADDAEKAEALLESIGVLEIDNNQSDKVTRADFACYVGRLIGVDEYTAPTEMYFRDVPTTHWAANCVNSLAAFGAISYDGVTMFRPDDIITVDEALKILVEILGYGVVAEVKGGYPTGYFSVANMIDLRSGISGAQEVSLIDAAMMLYNAANAKLYIPVSYGGSQNEYKQSDTDTLLSVYHNIYYTEGIVDATELTSVSSQGGTGENEISIDGVVYECDENMFDYIGTQVSVYYRQTYGGDKREIVVIALENDKDDIITVTDDDFISFESDYVLKYYALGSEKVKSINISKSASFIYNGVYVNENIRDYMNIDYGEIRAIKDKNGAFSTIIITEYQTVPIGYTDTERGYVYSAADNSVYFDLSGKDTSVYIFDEDKNRINVGSIAQNNVLTIYESPNKFIYAYLSRKTVDGTIERLVNTDNKIKITVGGNEYVVDKKFYEKNKTAIKSGKSVKLYLDIRGTVAYITIKNDNSYEYGYLTNAVLTGDISPELSVKIFTSDGSLGVYKTDETVYIDEVKYKELSDARSALCKQGTTEIQPRLVRFIADDKGIIKKIDTEKRGANETDDSLTRTAYTADGKSYDYISVGILGKKIAFDKSTILFKVPKDKDAVNATEKMFSSTNLARRIDWLDTEISAYTANSESGVSEVVVQKLEWSNAAPESRYNIMFEELYTALDDDGNEVERIVGRKDGVQVEYDIDSDVSLKDSGIEKGDLLILAVNAGNTVLNYKLVYDADKNIIYDNDAADAYKDNIFSCNGANYFAAQNMRFGYAASVKGSVVSMSYTNGGEVEEIYPVPSSITATVYDSTLGDGVFYKGGITDIADYDNSGVNCSRLIVYAEYGVWKSYYIYK